MVLHRLTQTKDEATKQLRVIKKKNRELKKTADKNKTDEQVVKPAIQIGRSMLKSGLSDAARKQVMVGVKNWSINHVLKQVVVACCCCLLLLFLALQMHDTLRALSFINAPVILMQLVTLLFMANGFMKQDLHMVEYFAGKMEVPCHQFWLYMMSMYEFMC